MLLHILMSEPSSFEVPANMEIRQSSVHGSGAFAARPIAAGTRIVEYVGQKITKAESLHRCEQGNDFIFHVDDQWDLDGSVSWNPARFLNHSCAPNCEAVMEDGQIFIVATRAILSGEELTFDYGYDLQDYQDHPCHCGAVNCVGFIVAGEFHDDLRGRKPGLAGTDLACL
jgi:SET domain-containing protein